MKIPAVVEEYLASERVALNWKLVTEKMSRSKLTRWAEFMAERGAKRLQDVTRVDVEAYLAHLLDAPRETERRRGHRPEGRRPAKPGCRAHDHGTALRRFFSWAEKSGHLLVSPMKGMKFRRGPDGPPRDVLTIGEVSRLLEAPNTATAAGLRDRAIIELLYSCGLRRSEVVNLDLTDVDLSRQRVDVHEGKGGKDRVVPLGKTAGEWLARYLAESRPLLERGSAEGSFFLNTHGERCAAGRINKVVVQHRDAAGISKRATAHSLRHTFATHLLESGADLRHVQELLGHARVTTTAIYTRVTPVDLTAAHRKHHPRGRKEPATT